MQNYSILSMSHFVILKRKQSSQLLNITQTWDLKLLLGWEPGLAEEFWNPSKEISAEIDEERSALCSTFQSKNFYLLCINFRGNFLKYLLCVGVKSECSKRPQRERLDRCCQQGDHKKSCNRPIINSELQKNPKAKRVQETWGIWFKPTQVKKFRHQGETVLLSQTALRDDGCVVSAPEMLRIRAQLLPVKCPSYSKATLIQNMSPNLETVLQANKYYMT